MIAPNEHHPQGPSQLASLALCGAFVANPEGAGPAAAAGSLCHRAWAEEDLNLLGGDLDLERQVLETTEFFARSTRDFTGANYRERTLGIKGLFFGTLDALHFNAKGTQAYIGDAKFGQWSVAEARKNWQGLAYVLLVFVNFPRIQRIVLEFYMVKHGRSTRAVFLRRSLPRLRTKITAIVERAKRIAAGIDLQPSDFTPHPDVCSFCHRVGCPARTQLVAALVGEFSGAPVALPSFDLVRLTPEQLGFLKSALANPIKTWVAALDSECKRRVFDCDETIPGYEVREKSSKRSVISASAIDRAVRLLATKLENVYPEITFPLEGIITENIELPLGELEKLVAKFAPRGQAMRCQQIISETLSEAKLITQHPIFYLAMIRE